jgi:hypothetical protein
VVYNFELQTGRKWSRLPVFVLAENVGLEYTQDFTDKELILLIKKITRLPQRWFLFALFRFFQGFSIVIASMCCFLPDVSLI